MRTSVRNLLDQRRNRYEPITWKSFKAILIGVLAYVGGSIAASIVGGAILGISFIRQGVPESDIEARLIQSVQGLEVLVGILIVGFGFALLGGFIAGRIAKRGEVTHASMAGVLAAVLEFFALADPETARFIESLPLWFNAVAFLLIVPTFMLGGQAAKQE